MIKFMYSIPKNLSFKHKHIINLFSKNFTIYSNQHQRIYEYIDGKKVIYDKNTIEYEPTIRAFLEKRWTTKKELPSKIYIIDELPEIKDSLNTQRLVFMKILYDEIRLTRLSDREEYDSKFFISIAAEEHFKPLIDEYLKKVLVNGSVPPMNKLTEYNQIIDKVKKIYLRFFYGDELSELEKEIEFAYLTQKQSKYLNWLATERPIYRCIWTNSQQKRIENMKNWISRDLRFYDDYRPIYEPLNINKKRQLLKDLKKLNNNGLLKKIFIKYLGDKAFSDTSTNYNTDQVIELIMNRLLFYITSLEFIRVLNIPPDFHIEHTLLNIHLWLLTNRLYHINTNESKYIAERMENIFDQYTLTKANNIHLMKKNDLIKNVNDFMEANRNIYNYHFNINTKTSQNHYYKLDALIWSTVFLEKVDRYSDLVYLISEYVIKHYEYLQTLTLDDFLNANFDWDIYKIPVDYKQKLKKINPPLTEDELQNEKESNSKIKKYEYSYDDPTIELPINAEVNKKINRRFAKIGSKAFEIIRKYKNMETYDYFSEREEKEKEMLKNKDKYIWSNEKMEKNESIEDIRKKLKAIKEKH